MLRIFPVCSNQQKIGSLLKVYASTKIMWSRVFANSWKTLKNIQSFHNQNWKFNIFSSMLFLRIWFYVEKPTSVKYKCYSWCETQYSSDFVEHFIHCKMGKELSFNLPVACFKASMKGCPRQEFLKAIWYTRTRAKPGLNDQTVRSWSCPSTGWESTAGGGKPGCWNLHKSKTNRLRPNQ